MKTSKGQQKPDCIQHFGAVHDAAVILTMLKALAVCQQTHSFTTCPEQPPSSSLQPIVNSNRGPWPFPCLRIFKK